MNTDILMRVVNLKPSQALQTRMSDLLARNKVDELTIDEEIELESYLTLEHWVRLAKADAYKQLANAE